MRETRSHDAPEAVDMPGGKEKALRWLIGLLVVGLLAFCGLVAPAFCPQVAGPLIQAAAAVCLVLLTVVYIWKTWQLAQAARDQVQLTRELAEKPIVLPLEQAVIEQQPPGSTGQSAFDEVRFNLINAGTGPALDVFIHCRFVAPAILTHVGGWSYGPNILPAKFVAPGRPRGYRLWPGGGQADVAPLCTAETAVSGSPRLGFVLNWCPAVSFAGTGWELEATLWFQSAGGRFYETKSRLKDGDADWFLVEQKERCAEDVADKIREVTGKAGYGKVGGRPGPGINYGAF